MKMDKKIDAVIYSRVSTDLQSFKSQNEDLVKWAKNNDHTIVKIFGEKVSGYNLTKERKEYDGMKEYVIENNIKHILIWELSRFGRSTRNILNEIEFFTTRGVNIFFKKENTNTLDNNPASKLLLGTLSNIAEFERMTIVGRSQRGITASILAGKKTGFPQMPYGLSFDKQNLIIIEPTEAKTIGVIFKMFLQGSSIRGIATYLNSLNIPTRSTLLGKKRKLKSGGTIPYIWKTNTIRKILHSTIMKGDRHYKNDVVKVPAIISDEDWTEVQSRFKSKQGYRNRTVYEYLLKSKIKCGKCKMVYISHTHKKYKDKPSSFYKCNGAFDDAIKCKEGQFTSKTLDDNVYELLFIHQNVIHQLYEDSLKDFKLEDKENQVEFYKEEIIEQNNRKKRIISLFKDGHVSEVDFKKDNLSIKNNIQENENLITKIERAINNFKKEDKIINVFTSLVIESDFSIKRDFVLKYVDEIIINKVIDTNIDFEKLMHKTRFKGDKTIYVEIYAFGLETPIKAVMTNLSKIKFADSSLQFKDGFLKGPHTNSDIKKYKDKIKKIF